MPADKCHLILLMAFTPWMSTRAFSRFALSSSLGTCHCSSFCHAPDKNKPDWAAAGIMDWVLHRQTQIERTSRLKESLLYIVQMMEVALPGLMAVLRRSMPWRNPHSRRARSSAFDHFFGKDYPLLSLRQFVPGADLEPQQPSLSRTRPTLLE